MSHNLDQILSEILERLTRIETAITAVFLRIETLKNLTNNQPFITQSLWLGKLTKWWAVWVWITSMWTNYSLIKCTSESSALWPVVRICSWIFVKPRTTKRQSALFSPLQCQLISIGWPGWLQLFSTPIAKTFYGRSLRQVLKNRRIWGGDCLVAVRRFG